MTALATLDQLADRMTITVDTDRATAVLDDVSAAVRNYTGQQITAGSSTIRLRVHGGRVTLPQRPVTDVTAVTDINGATVSCTWDGLDIVRLTIPTVLAFEYDYPSTVDVVDVTYDYGYASVPDDIVTVVCNVAARCLATGAEMAGVTQESIAGYSVSYGAIGASGPVGFFRQEQAVLDAYRGGDVVWQGTIT